MVKPPPTVDRIGFYFETSIDDAGKFIAMLTKEGVERLKHELITDVITFRQKPRTNHDIKSEDFLTAWIKDHPTFRAREAIAAFKEDGRTAGAGYTALRMLTENKVLKKLGEGQYSRADVKHLAGPNKKAKAKPEAKAVATQNKYAVNNFDYVVRLAKRGNGRFTSAKIKEHFAKDGRATSGVGPTITRLVKNKVVKSLGDGAYELIVPKVNGAAAPTAPEVTEAANG